MSKPLDYITMARINEAIDRLCREATNTLVTVRQYAFTPEVEEKAIEAAEAVAELHQELVEFFSVATLNVERSRVAGDKLRQ